MLNIVQIRFMRSMHSGVGVQRAACPQCRVGSFTLQHEGVGRVLITSDTLIHRQWTALIASALRRTDAGISIPSEVAGLVWRLVFSSFRHHGELMCARFATVPMIASIGTPYFILLYMNLLVVIPRLVLQHAATSSKDDRGGEEGTAALGDQRSGEAVLISR